MRNIACFSLRLGFKANRDYIERPHLHSRHADCWLQLLLYQNQNLMGQNENLVEISACDCGFYLLYGGHLEHVEVRRQLSGVHSLPGTELRWSGYSVVLMEAKGWSAGDGESESVPG